MCLNCGCGMMDDTMGKEDNITLTKLVKAAIAENQDGKTTLSNMKASIDEVSPGDLDRKIQELKTK